jgi:hypothetical protein
MLGCFIGPFNYDGIGSCCCCCCSSSAAAAAAAATTSSAPLSPSQPPARGNGLAWKTRKSEQNILKSGSTDFSLCQLQWLEL